VVEVCAQGYSLTAFAGQIGVSRACITKWAKAHPDFLFALGAAKAAATLWYENRGRNIVIHGGTSRQAAMVMLHLCNFAPEDFKKSRNVNVGDRL
jgi:hypothetical protein